MVRSAVFLRRIGLAAVTVVMASLLLFPAAAFAAHTGVREPASVRSAQCDGGLPSKTPLLAVVGASFSAGVGATSPRLAWPEDLARLLRWHLVLSADPGAGYLNPGAGRRGPFSRLLARLHLARLDPAVVIVQGGHDDLRYPPGLVEEQAFLLISEIEKEAPSARIGVLSVFVGRRHPPLRAWEVNRAIIAGARLADPSVMIFDPMGSHWRFAHRRHHLHPTDRGDRWIARHLSHELVRDGALSAVTACQPVFRFSGDASLHERI